MTRFYHHVPTEKRCSRHGAAAFGHYGSPLPEAIKYLGVKDIVYNQPASLPYPHENLFA